MASRRGTGARRERLRSRGSLLRILRALKASLWFVPTAMALAVVLLAGATLAVDDLLAERHEGPLWDWMRVGGPDGARTLLATLAGSLITVVSVVFSITMVVLSQASTQFGPRQLGNFMRDRGTQVVLGTFTATFLYCLVVLGFVGEEENVPRVSVLTAGLLGACSLGVLIYFIHHIAERIQVDHLIATIASEMDSAIDRLRPEPAEARRGREREPEPPRGPSVELAAGRRGYVQTVDRDRLLRLCARHDLVARVLVRAGAPCIEGQAVLQVHGAEALPRELREDLLGCVDLGAVRTPEDDLEFTFRQLVELAVRSLSPGINDPYTANVCIDRLGSGLAQLARRAEADKVLRDEQGRPRVLAAETDFAGVCALAFHRIRQNCQHHVAVHLRLLETQAALLGFVRREEDAAVLADHAAAVHRAAERAVEERLDREDLARRWRQVRELLEERWPGLASRLEEPRPGRPERAEGRRADRARA